MFFFEIFKIQYWNLKKDNFLRIGRIKINNRNKILEVRKQVDELSQEIGES